MPLVTKFSDHTILFLQRPAQSRRLMVENGLQESISSKFTLNTLFCMSQRFELGKQSYLVMLRKEALQSARLSVAFL